MTREHKLALILGFALVMVVGVLISDHLSGARQATIESVDALDTPSYHGIYQPQTMPSPSQATPQSDRLAFERAGVESSYWTTPGQTAQAETQRVPYEPRPEAEEAQRGQPFTQALAERVDRIRQFASENNIDLSRTTPAVQTDQPAREQATPRQPGREPVATFRLHDVRAGDSFWNLSERYYSDASLYKALEAFNKDRLGQGGVLRVGATIMIPEARVLRGEVDARDIQPAPDASRATAPPRAEERRYTVQRGDTLGDISQRLLGTTRRWREIYELNKERIDNPDVVPVGTVLRIPAR